MSKAEEGNTVKVHYTGKTDNGNVFDSSDGRDPLKFKLGEGKVIPGFENAVLGMEIGDKKTINIPKDKAYGPYNNDLVAKVKKENLPKDLKVEIGQRLQINPSDKVPFAVTIIKVEEEDVTLDGNHPLAGEDLIFDIELVAIA